MKFHSIPHRGINKIVQMFAVVAVFISPFTVFAADFPDKQSIVVFGGEKILDFHSNININTDATVRVEETIQVVALGQEIKRGIYRDFPTKYQDRYGNSHNVGFNIVSVMKDGSPEDYHTEDMDNGIRVYFGNKDVYLAPGVYTYKFTYETNRQVGYFDTHDEFYWNVTGNGWIFPIDNASATVTLPGNIRRELLTASGYTGPQGSKVADLSSSTSVSSALFETTKPLNSYEGLTIVLEFPKGIIHEPTALENFKYFLRDNFNAWIDLVMLILIFIYYYFSWIKVGRDPKPRSIIPQYDAPRGFSPGAIGYISKMGFENKAMVAMIINMGVKGYLKVDELKVNYRLTKISDNDNTLSEEEKKLSEEMFEKDDTFEIKKSNYSKVMACETILKKTFKDTFRDNYFVRNWKYIGYGIGASLIALAVASGIESLENIFPSVFIITWFSLWSFFVYVFVKQAFNLWPRKGKEAVSMIIFSLFLLFMEVIVIFLFGSIFSPIFIFFSISLILINIVFSDILKRRTPLGREVQDEIEGFRMFLSVTEKDRMNFHNPPERTPELFEKFLPYALVLGVENNWAEQFKEVFDKLGPDGYSPHWYHGNALSTGSLAGFVSGMSSSMNSSISSSSTAPGSSSGSGGGGSSGGGGGGGGGGGW